MNALASAFCRPLVLLAALAAPVLAEPAEPSPDDLIAQRLGEIFSETTGMSAIEPEVRLGIVTLRGTVPTSRAAEDAVEIAAKMDGVVHVLDRLSEPTDLESRLTPAATKLQSLGTQLIQLLPLIGIAMAVLVAGWLLGRLLASRDRWLRRIGLNDLSVELARRALHTATFLVALLIALEILDATAVVGAVLGVAGVAGVALGFAFRNIVENYLAGILLGARNPFAIGDQVQIGEFTGNVARLTSRDTVLMTPEGNRLRIPNSKIITSEMVNFTRNPKRRFDFAVGITPDADMLAVKRLATETLRAIRGVLESPAPTVLFEELADSTVTVRCHGWIDQRESDFLKMRSEAIRLVKAAFDDAGIEMPEPTYRLRLGESLADTLPQPTPDRPSPPQGHGASEPRPNVRADAENADVAPDRAIDAQLHEELSREDEENLLDRKD